MNLDKFNKSSLFLKLIITKFRINDLFVLPINKLTRSELIDLKIQLS